MFHRRAEEGLAVLTTALQSPQPLWALWKFSTAPEATRLTMEFMGLANRRKALRAEIVDYAERFRQEQNKAIADALRQRGIDASEVPPVVWTVFATSVSQVTGDGTGARMSTGDAETFAFCEQWLRRLEGEQIPEPDRSTQLTLPRSRPSTTVPAALTLSRCRSPGSTSTARPARRSVLRRNPPRR